MWKSLLLGAACASAAFGQIAPSSMDLANLREDVRGLNQRVGELSLRIEQLERENTDLKLRAGTINQSFVTVAQLNDAIADLSRTLRTAIGTSKMETLQQVSTQLEKLGQQTNAALESLAKAQGLRAATPVSTTSAAAGNAAENPPKEGSSYTVQKGDTLATIAKKTGAKQQDIINANKLSDPSHIVVGQTLVIPGGK
jgi:LysM repeat protein